MINHKRDFTIESVIGSEKAEFQFPDVESAKNAWRLCVLQHMFYKQYEANGSGDPTENSATPIAQKSHVDINKIESYEDITSAYKTVTSHPLQQRAQSTSCLDLNTPTDIDKLRSLLPSYRPAPDYETAVQQKYRNSSGPINTRENVRNAHQIMYSSQPEIHQNEAYTTHLRYPDVTHNNIEQKMASIYTPGHVAAAAAAAAANVVDLTENLGMLHLYKPPPPYPSNRISSNSTPDLAGMSQQLKPHSHVMNNLVSGSSPDLVSSGNFLNQHYVKPYDVYAGHHAQPVHRSHSYLPPQHGTYENLSSIFNNNMLGRPQAQAVIVENPNITKHIKKVYDEHGNIIYCMPANMKQILQENQLPSTGFVVTRNQNAVVAHDPQLNNSSEPIYENIPFPWQNDNSQGRARTQSIHSAPEVSQAINQTVVRSQLSPNVQESLYANIETNGVKLNIQNSSTNNLTDASSILNRTVQSLSNSTNNVNDASVSPKTMSRTNTFIVNKNSNNSSTNTENSCVSGETFTDVSSTSSNNKVKKRRWGILIGRSKSSEKVKSATLGREKEKNKEKNQSNNKHRWSTGLPRLHPLPPSISKETMVRIVPIFEIAYAFCFQNLVSNDLKT